MKTFFLSIETSSPTGSLALFEKADQALHFIDQIEWVKSKSHSEVITARFSELLDKNNLTSNRIHALICGVGPGSFTGLRVGVNFAKVLAYHLDIPIYALNSLQTLAFIGHKQELPVLSLINAFRNSLYNAVYSFGSSQYKEVISPNAKTPLELEKSLGANKYLCVGPGFCDYEKSFTGEFKSQLTFENSSFKHPNARTLGQFFDAFDPRPQPLSWKDLNPLYIRASEAEEKLRSGLLKPLPQ